MKFTTAVSVIAATTTALPECFGSEPTSMHRAAPPSNGVRRQDSAAAAAATATNEKKMKNRESRQFRRMRSPSGTLKNRKFLNRNNNNDDDMVADTTQKTTNVECDPTTFSQADIGILRCQNHEALLFGKTDHDDIRVACLEDPESSLGGFCSEIVTLPFISTRQLQLSPADVFYWCYDSEYADWNCNCADFDEYTYSALDCSYQYCSDCEGGNCSQDTFSTVVTYGGREWTECYDYGSWEVCLEGSVDYYTTPRSYSYDCTFQYKGTEYCCEYDPSVAGNGCGFRKCSGSTLPFEICDLIAACPNLDSDIPWFTQPPASTPIAPPVAPISQPVAPPVAAPISQPVAPPVAAPISQPVAPPVAAPISQPVAPPVAAPISQPVAPPVAAPISQPVAPPVAAPISQPVAPPVAAPISQPVAPPVAAPISQPVAPPVAAPISQPVAPPVAAPVASPVASPVDPAPTCLANAVTCTLDTDCCSGLCKFRRFTPDSIQQKTCQSAPKLGRVKLAGQSRGGAATTRISSTTLNGGTRRGIRG